MILQSVPNALLVVAGQPHPAYSSRYVSELADMAARLGVSRAVRFVDRRDVHPVCAFAEFFVVSGTGLAHCAAFVLILHIRRCRYLSAEELEYLFQAAEVFVCAHTSEGQSSSGTLALAMAAGAVPVSTRFAQAQELVADGRGVLVPFRSANDIAIAVRTRLSCPG